MSQDFPPISEYAFLSDCHTAALVGPDGAVEWLCTPRFDGPSFLARMLDRDLGGAWELEVADASVTERLYVGDSLALRTTWEGDDAGATVHDFLATARSGKSGEITPVGRLLRWVTCTRGQVTIRSRLLARPDYASREARWTAHDGVLVEESGVCLSGNPQPGLTGGVPFLETTLRESESVVLALDYTGDRAGQVNAAEAAALLDGTVAAWRGWADRSDYQGVGAQHVKRSALVLRGLLFDENDGLLAAPTTSLPEWPGGPRNWDYRYVWHRDAALVVLELLQLGHREEAERYLRFIIDQCHRGEDWLAPMFAIDGGPVDPETDLDHLHGYAGSRPVRRGNEAADQHQLDVFGHVMDAAFAYHEVTGGLSERDLKALWRVVEAARRHWREPDAGIWEVQGPQRHWTHSKVYAWACFDRAVRLAELTGDSTVPVEEWRRERDLVHADVLAHGFDKELGSFVQSYGSTNVDGSLLRIPLMGFLDGDDPRVVGTLDRIADELGDEYGLIHRYDPEATDDGLNTPEGAFFLCSFEMVTALVLAGRVGEAERRFATLCERAGQLGLFSEQMDARGVMLGNYPQAFTHLAVIQAALNLNEAGRQDALHHWADRHGS